MYSSDLENRFTKPSEFCPNPEYWHSPDSEGSEDEVSEFIGALVRLIKPKFVVETGSWRGDTTIEINYALNQNGGIGRGVSLEKDAAMAQEASRRVRNRFGDTPLMPVLNVNSMEYEPVEDIDFAFFDSWQEGRALEFMRFYEMGRLKKDAIVAFHDTAPHHQVRKHILPLGKWVDVSIDEKSPQIHRKFINLIDFHTPRGLILGQVI